MSSENNSSPNKSNKHGMSENTIAKGFEVFYRKNFFKFIEKRLDFHLNSSVLKTDMISSNTQLKLKATNKLGLFFKKQNLKRKRKRHSENFKKI